MNYYEHHLGDFAEATAHLSFVEDAAYSRLLRKIYSTERPLPSEKKSVHRLLGARTKEERKAIDSMLDEFFDLREDGWHNDRADREIARFLDKQSKAKASANARWSQSERNANASGQEPPSPDANAMRTHSEGNAPRARSTLQTPDSTLQTPGSTTEAKLPSVGRASRLPLDWEPGETGLAYAAKQGLTNGRAVAELENFRDHWVAKPGKDGTALDWQAKWRTWVRRSLDFNRGGRPGAADEASIRERNAAVNDEAERILFGEAR